MKIAKGIIKKQVRQLLSYSQTDPEILKFTGDKKRFSSLSKFNKWSKNRTIYTLTDKQNNLLGIIWFGKKNGITFAIRTYPPARGKGYSAKFLTKVMKDFLKSEDYKNMGGGKIWLETHSNNFPAISLYTKTGWHEETIEKSDKKIFIYDTTD